MNQQSTISKSDKRERLKAIIAARSFSNDREITLASGRKSWLYFNMKPTMLDPQGAYLLGELLVDEIEGLSIDYVGGLAMGAVPIVSFVAPAIFQRHPATPIRAFFIRKEVKNHGTKARIEGLGPGETLAQKRIVMVEDVTTTGGSLLDAVTEVRAAGGLIVKAITLVDRQEGAAEELAKHGLTLTPLFRAEDFTG